MTPVAGGDGLDAAVAALLAEERGEAVEVVGSRPVGGGCIHSARLVELAGGERLFVKSNTADAGEMFETEAAGLEALAAVGAIRVPRRPRAGSWEGGVFLVMEAIEEGSPRSDSGGGFFERFGRAFAALHREGRGERFGFDHDNFIGATPQPNAWSDDWVGFWRRHRLGHQLRLAGRRGLSDAELDRLGDRLMDRLGEWIDLPDEPPCLLHGDLWSGNFLADSRGEPVLVDPAVYYGHREADLAMTRLFGGFPPAFHRAYEEAWPLPPGSSERLAVYELYHLLNHLNLFGRGYRDRSVAVLRRLVAPPS